jgi:steroid 5-alpha reductase family enzyme
MTPTALSGPTLLVMAAVMALAWLVQRLSRNVGWVDVIWTLGTGAVGIGVALIPSPGFAGPNHRQWIIAALVAIWSLRLALHVAVGVASGPEDGRYIALRREWGSSFQSRLFWFLEIQAVAPALLVLAILVAARNPAVEPRPIDLAGALVLALGIFGERTADRQLKRFKADPANRGRICDAGLWRWSRHPNYFFEWFVWLAFPLFAFGSDYPWFWLAFIAPAAMYLVLVHGTGIPHLEAHMLRAHGRAYRNYQARTHAFFLLPPRQKAAGPASGR